MEKHTCTFPGCDKPYTCRGYCCGHYDQLLKGRELQPLRPRRRTGCSIKGCPEPHRSLGWCEFHYNRNRWFGDPLAVPAPRRRWEPGPCDFPGCPNVRGGKRWYCPPHARQLLRGEELHPLPPQGTTRKYAIDHHFFDQIGTPEQAYWLGFITADGCVSRGSVLTINLAVADSGHLEKLGAALSSDYPITPSSSGKPSAGIVRWYASSIRLVRALGALGITARKSATVVPWDGPADLMRHYWRGMVDGDGGMGHSPGRNPTSPDNWRIYLTGSRACVEAFALWGSGICGSRTRPRLNGQSQTCWQWTVGGNRMARLLANELYGDCTVSLDRKQALADAMLGMAAQS